jgi:hypothetical protein
MVLNSVGDVMEPPYTLTVAGKKALPAVIATGFGEPVAVILELYEFIVPGPVSMAKACEIPGYEPSVDMISL